MAKRLGIVKIDVGYVVDLDNEDMVDSAKDALCEDAINAVKYDEIYSWIEIYENDGTLKEKDIPAFLIGEEDE